MDEEDNFVDYCILNTKKTHQEPFEKLLRTTPNSDNAKKVYKTADKTYEIGEPLTTKTAVEYLLGGKLKTAVCRYCLNITAGLSDLDQIMHIAGTGTLYKVTIRQMIACFYPIKAKYDQDFPNKICQKCLDKAISAYLFTQQCEQAERALLFCFDDMYDKLEKLDPLERPKKRGRQKLNPNHNILYAEHRNVIDYAEPIRNIINIEAESLTNEPDWKEFECKKCWQVFTNMESLLNHEKVHPKNMWYSCRLCGKSFPKFNQLKKHHNQVHVLKKGPEVNVEKSFKCKECEHETENYLEHLQHIEKHKFKSVMEHLIEKKTDKLCMVCLNKSSNLVDLDQIVCVHGGYPGLMGDKTLHTVLASTLPDQNSYKYQELFIAQKAKKLTITKRKIDNNNLTITPNLNIPTDMNIQLFYNWSSPVIITKDKFRTDDFYHYVFCDPEFETVDKTEGDIAVLGTESLEKTNEMVDGLDKSDNKIATPSKNIKRTEESNQRKIIPDEAVKQIYVKAAPKEAVTESVKPILHKDGTGKSKNLDGTYNNEDGASSNDLNKKNIKDDLLNDIDENDESVSVKVNEEQSPPKKKHKTRSEPKLVRSDDHKRNKTKSKKNKNTNNKNKSDKHAIDLSLDNSDDKIVCVPLEKEITAPADKVILTKEKSDPEPEANEELVKKDCKWCWFFQNAPKCDYCRKPFKQPNKEASITSIQVRKEKEEIIDKNLLIAKQIQENAGKTDLIIKPVKKEIEIEETWQCDLCQTFNSVDRTMCPCIEEEKSKVDSVPAYLIHEEETMMDFKDVNVQENVKFQEQIIDLSSTESMDVELVESGTKDEEMDVDDNPVVENSIQFNIGAITITGPRRAKRPLRKIPKAFHK